ncbi:MAG: nucleotide exchange factor GrpE [Deltaproteobacteria bacterium]|nr:nucleotide exchange factor GrpE [Deltaproteobacteria bacterium]
MSIKKEKKPLEQAQKAEQVETKEQEKQKPDLKTLKEENKKLEIDLAEKTDKFLRLLAEFENFKKRVAKQTSDLRKYSNESILKDILLVADNLDRAILAAKTEKAEKAPLLEGVEMTLTELVKIFEQYEVTPIKSEGKAFDPNFHQAMTKQESEEHPENTVISELQKGYMICDRLLRPAMVVVSEKKKDEEET